MDTLRQEVRFALRKLWRSPGFTAVAVLALALGIGANTSIFSIVNAVIIRPLPFEDSERLMVLWEIHPETARERDPVSPLTFRDWRQSTDSFEDLAAWAWWSYTLTGVDEPERVLAIRATPSLFEILGAETALGRVFTEEEDVRGAPNVAVIGHGMWQRLFGGDPEVIGRTVRLDLEVYTIIGVMPEGFRFPDDDQWELWTPVRFTEAELSTRARRMFNVVGKLAPETSLEAARAEMAAIASGLAEEHPETNLGWSVGVQPAEELIADSNRHLLIMLAAVGLVLLVACANVANLMLARAAGRRRELAIRSAIGASRKKLISQLLVESLVLAILGGGAALLVAVWGIDLILAVEPGELPHWNPIGIDGNVLLFTAALALGTAVLAGLVPALSSSSVDLNESLKSGGGRFTSESTTRRARDFMVIAEVALSVILLVGAGLLIKSFAKLLQEDLGFDPDHVVAANIFLPEAEYPEAHQRRAFYDNLLARVDALPGVVSAGATLALPLNPVSIDFDLPFQVEGNPTHEPGEEPQADYRVITPDYLEVMKIQLLQGRALTERDRADAPRVMLINETMARRYFARVNPIGKRIDIPIGGSHEIVGVIDDVRHRGLDSQPRPEVYVPFQQSPFGGMVVVARSDGNDAAVAQGLARSVLEVDPVQTVTRLTTMGELIDESVGQRRFNMALLGSLAALALTLAAIGLYGLISYAVNQRSQEIGVRMAMGARSGDVIRMIVADALRLTGVGSLVGILGALVLTRLLAGLLYDTSPVDLATFVIVPVILGVVALLASYAPAVRATRVDPVLALRRE